MTRFAAAVRLVRPRHWVKNALVLVPLVFSGGLWDADALFRTVFASVAFCLASSSVYALNDARDAEADRADPVKRARPVASGGVPAWAALTLSALLGFWSLAVCAIAQLPVSCPILVTAFLAVNTAYNLGAKEVPVLDVAALASGYLIRVAVGAAACGVAVSDWLYLTALSGSLYLGLGKRRGELRGGGLLSRPVLSSYPEGFLAANMYVCEGLTVAFYSLWARESPSGLMLWSVPIVLGALLRYSLDVESGRGADPTSALFGDRALACLFCAWCAMTMLALYLPLGG